MEKVQRAMESPKTLHLPPNRSAWLTMEYYTKSKQYIRIRSVRCTW